MAEIGRTRLPQVRISGDGKIEWRDASAASKYLLEMRVSGDTNPRFRIRADGRIEWGPGNAVPDNSLIRVNASWMRFSQNLSFSNKYVAFMQSQPTISIVVGNVVGDSQNRILIQADGTMLWGPGDVVGDCQLSRRVANILNTPDRMEVGTLGVGNSAAGNTLGNLVKAIEVFDTAGVSLGKIPVYDDITQV